MVHHMYQKFVLKNDGWKTSSIRFAPRDSSDVAMIAIRSSLSRLLKPITDASIFSPFVTSLDSERLLMRTLKSCISSLTVLPGSVREGMNDNRSNMQV